MPPDHHSSVDHHPQCQINPTEQLWDWDFIASQLPPRTRTLVQSSNLPARAFYRLVAGAAIRERSLSQQVQAILLDAIDKWWVSDWQKDINFKATQLGVPPDQLFVELILSKLPNSTVELPDSSNTIGDSECSPTLPE